MMIEDETEEYVKSTYEKGPITSGFYSNRKQLSRYRLIWCRRRWKTSTLKC